MNQWNRRTFVQTAASAAALSAFGLGHAQTARRETARILVGFAPGGMPDVVSRRVAHDLTGAYARAVIVDNKAGAGGQLAVSELARSPNDGSTLLFSASAMLSIFPHVFKSLPYNPFSDVEPVCSVGNLAMALAVGPLVPASVTNINELAAWLRSNPRYAAYGTPGAGSPLHLMGMLLGQAINQPLAHVPYRGTQLAITDLLGGQIPMVMSTQGEFFQHIKDGKVRVLAMTGASRSPLLPDVKTFAEQGLPQVDVNAGFIGFWMPRGTPRPVIQEAYNALRPVLQNPAVIKTMHNFGIMPDTQPSDVAARMLRNEFEFWRQTVAKTGFKAEE